MLSLFKILSNKSNHIIKNEDKSDFRKVISYYNPKINNLNLKLNTDLELKSDEKIPIRNEEENKAVKKLPKQKRVSQNLTQY